MKSSILIHLAVLVLCCHLATSLKLAFTNCTTPETNEDIYKFVAEDLNRTKNVSLSEFKGKVLLIINVATFCDSTTQYKGLRALQTEFGSENFSVLAFPCNQFGLQEQAANATELLNAIKYVRPGNGYEPNFPMFWKVNVNGADEHPLFTYLKNTCPPTRDYFIKRERLFYDGFKHSDIKWNFEKFVINQKGFPVARFDASQKPEAARDTIAKLLNQ